MTCSMCEPVRIVLPSLPLRLALAVLSRLLRSGPPTVSATPGYKSKHEQLCAYSRVAFPGLCDVGWQKRAEATPLETQGLSVRPVTSLPAVLHPEPGITRATSEQVWLARSFLIVSCFLFFVSNFHLTALKTIVSLVSDSMWGTHVQYIIMPSRCCVTGCKGKYNEASKVQRFSFSRGK